MLQKYFSYRLLLPFYLVYFMVATGHGGHLPYMLPFLPKNRSLIFQGMFIVALPFGVLHGGYWGILAMVGISHICCHTGKILVECLYEPCDEGGGQEPLKVKYRSRFFVRSGTSHHIYRISLNNVLH